MVNPDVTPITPSILLLQAISIQTKIEDLKDLLKDTLESCDISTSVIDEYSSFSDLCWLADTITSKKTHQATLPYRIETNNYSDTLYSQAIETYNEIRYCENVLRYILKSRDIELNYNDFGELIGLITELKNKNFFYYDKNIYSSTVTKNIDLPDGSFIISWKMVNEGVSYIQLRDSNNSVFGNIGYMGNNTYMLNVNGQSQTLTSQSNNEEILFKYSYIQGTHTIEVNEDSISITEYSKPSRISKLSISQNMIKELKIEEVILFNPPLDGTDNITSWTNVENKTEDGLFYSHGSFLSDGWSNNGLWRLEFDYKYEEIKIVGMIKDYPYYIGLMPICSEEINPFTDEKRVNYCLTSWEGGVIGASDLGRSSWVQESTMISNGTQFNNFTHVCIEKISDTYLKITLNNDSNLVWIAEFPNLVNLTTLHIGSRDNPSNRDAGDLVIYKNIIVR